MDSLAHTSIHTLKNGSTVTLRPIRPDDKVRLHAAFKKLDPTSIYTRFFGVKKDLSQAELQAATEVDFDTVVALVATMGSAEDEVIVGGGRYVVGGSAESAEVAFTVAEDYQGLGIASLVLAELVRIARVQDLRCLEADVLPGNVAMLSVFRRSGLPMTAHTADGVVHVTLAIAPPFP